MNRSRFITSSSSSSSSTTVMASASACRRFSFHRPILRSFTSPTVGCGRYYNNENDMFGNTRTQQFSSSRDAVTGGGRFSVKSARGFSHAGNDRLGRTRSNFSSTTKKTDNNTTTSNDTPPLKSSHSSDIDSGGRTNQERKKYKYIPEPVWSLQDLQLSSMHPVLPDEEMDRLARLSLIDVTVSARASDRASDSTSDNSGVLPKTESESESRRQKQLLQVNQDVANMMHMIQLVTEYDHDKHDKQKKKQTIDENRKPDGNDNDTGAIYDVVRGGSRFDGTNSVNRDGGGSGHTTTTTTTTTTMKQQDEQHTVDVWENLLKPKTITKGGGHEYFAIKTAVDDKVDTNQDG